MPLRQYSYQYETSPRKVRPEYDKPKKNSSYNKGKTKSKPKAKKVTTKKKENIVENNKKKQEELKAKNALITRAKVSIFFKCMILFAIMFFMVYRNSKISESFSQIQALQAQITEIQKENDQIEINIQNSINLNNIEQSAKVLLGMQKLTNKQTFYINLPKKDYVEARTEKVIIEEENSNWIEKTIEKIKGIF